jgi:cell division protein FtsN
MKQGELFQDLKPQVPASQDEESPETPEERFRLVLTFDKIIFIALAVLILLIVVFTFGVEHGKKLQRELSQNQRGVESITSLAEISAAQRSLTQKQALSVGKPLDKAISEIETEPAKPQPKPKKKFKLKIPILSSLFAKKKPQAPAPLAAPVTEAKLTEEPEMVPLPPIPVSEQPAEIPVEVISKTSPPKEAEPAESAEEEKAPEKGYEVRIMSVVEKTFADKAVIRLSKEGITASARKSGNYYIVLTGPYKTRAEADKMIKKVKKNASYKDAYIRHLS